MGKSMVKWGRGGETSTSKLRSPRFLTSETVEFHPRLDYTSIHSECWEMYIKRPHGRTEPMCTLINPYKPGIFLWDIGKQKGLFCLLSRTSSKNYIKMKKLPLMPLKMKMDLSK